MLTFNEVIESFARITPKKLAVQDEKQKLNFYQLAINGNNLAQFLLSKGVKKKDRIALLSYNCIAYAEIMYATAKLGCLIVPINFRLSLSEIVGVLNDSKPVFLFFEKNFDKEYFSIKAMNLIDNNHYISLDSSEIGIGCYHYNDCITFTNKDLIKHEPSTINDDWSLMYTSGTTGKPKGVVRSQGGYYLLSNTTAIELSIKKNDTALIVMPLCHANSFNFFCAYLTVGASINIYSKKSFEAKHFFSLINSNNITFTSLVPTHFIIILDYLKEHNITNALDRVFSFMISSAPARKDTKIDILKYFKLAKLYELYGSSESGWVTMLHPSEQFDQLGSVGKECVGSKPIKILNVKNEEVKDGEIGELYANTPYNFSYYWENKIKTEEAFLDEYITVGDLAFRNKKGYIQLVDRKNNMIISGGENIYPSEIENVLGSHTKIKDVAIVGYPDNKWGEIVCAFIILHKEEYLTKDELILFFKNKLSNYKCPKKIFFIHDNEMPKNATGKILHKKLKEKVINYIERD